MKAELCARYICGLVCAGITVLVAAFGGAHAQDWSTASREPVGLAPDPAVTPEAIVQVYGARAWGWRGLFGVHTWIAVKPTNAKAYTVYEVTGWGLRWNKTALTVSHRAPDGRWFGSAPELLVDRRGNGVDTLIGRIVDAVGAYPYAGEYRIWPGPNSNTFTAWVGRSVPDLELHLPSTAIGKDYLRGTLFATAPSGSGLQLSLFGIIGGLASPVEGVEVNILGLSFGIDPFRPAVKLPFVGRLGVPSRPALGANANGRGSSVRQD